MKTVGLVLLSWAFTSFGFTPVENSNSVDGHLEIRDSGIYGPEYSVQIQNMKNLAKEFPDIATYKKYGDSMELRELSALVFQDKAVEAEQTVLVTGATHGNEYLNIVDRLPDALLKSPSAELRKFLSRGGVVIFVPILNPDGYDKRSRGNVRGVDLNRDWPNPILSKTIPREKETKALFEFVKQETTELKTKLELAMDYHCCVSGMLLYPWGYRKGEYLPAGEQVLVDKVVDHMKSSFTRYGQIGTPPDTLYSAVGTTLDYWYYAYGATSVTYEGRYGSEKNFLANHVQWWNKIFAGL